MKMEAEFSEAEVALLEEGQRVRTEERAQETFSCGKGALGPVRIGAHREVDH